MKSAASCTGLDAKPRPRCVFPGARSVGRHVFNSTSPSIFMSHPSLRASIPIACHLHIPCTTRSAAPTGLCVARSSPIACAVISERSTLSPGKRLHHQRSSSSHDERSTKFGISETEVLHPLTPSASHSSFGTYSEGVQRAARDLNR
jgi:hypothetical protein